VQISLSPPYLFLGTCLAPNRFCRFSVFSPDLGPDYPLCLVRSLVASFLLFSTFCQWHLFPVSFPSPPTFSSASPFLPCFLSTFPPSHQCFSVGPCYFFFHTSLVIPSLWFLFNCCVIFTPLWACPVVPLMPNTFTFIFSPRLFSFLYMHYLSVTFYLEVKAYCEMGWGKFFVFRCSCLAIFLLMTSYPFLFPDLPWANFILVPNPTDRCRTVFVVIFFVCLWSLSFHPTPIPYPLFPFPLWDEFFVLLSLSLFPSCVVPLLVYLFTFFFPPCLSPSCCYLCRLSPCSPLPAHGRVSPCPLSLRCDFVDPPGSGTP